MRCLVAIAALLVVSTDGARAQTSPPQFCYVAQVAIIVDDVADFKYHRVVVAGIRQFATAASATAGNCDALDVVAVAAMRKAVEERLHDVAVAPPRLRTTIELRHADLDVVRSEVARLARLAREHAGTFKRVERVSVNASTELALPRLSSDDASAAACEDQNAALERAAAKFRWAC